MLVQFDAHLHLKRTQRGPKASGPSNLLYPTWRHCLLPREGPLTRRASRPPWRPGPSPAASARGSARSSGRGNWNGADTQPRRGAKFAPASERWRGLLSEAARAGCLCSVGTASRSQLPLPARHRRFVPMRQHNPARAARRVASEHLAPRSKLSQDAGGRAMVQPMKRLSTTNNLS